MGLSREVREIQKAAAVLACIQVTAEYDNEVEADLADAIEVVLDVITAAAVRIEVTLPASERGG
jgi:hypothetical protein